jgi:hypothetical protein
MPQRESERVNAFPGAHFGATLEPIVDEWLRRTLSS